MQFFGQNFPKMPKNAFLACFFLKICLRLKKFGRSRVFVVLSESSENQFGRPKKKISKIFKTFFKIPTPPEKILDPPLLCNAFLAGHFVRTLCGKTINHRCSFSFFCLITRFLWSLGSSLFRPWSETTIFSWRSFEIPNRLLHCLQ